MYFYPISTDRGVELVLLDGDRIAVLAALTVQQLLAELPAGQPPTSVSDTSQFPVQPVVREF